MQTPFETPFETSFSFNFRLFDVGGLAARDVIVHFYLVSFDFVFNFEVKDAGNGQHLFRKL